MKAASAGGSGSGEDGRMKEDDDLADKQSRPAWTSLKSRRRNHVCSFTVLERS